MQRHLRDRLSHTFIVGFHPCSLFICIKDVEISELLQLCVDKVVLKLLNSLQFVTKWWTPSSVLTCEWRELPFHTSYQRSWRVFCCSCSNFVAGIFSVYSSRWKNSPALRPITSIFVKKNTRMLSVGYQLIRCNLTTKKRNKSTSELNSDKVRVKMFPWRNTQHLRGVCFPPRSTARFTFSPGGCHFDFFFTTCLCLHLWILLLLKYSGKTEH